MFDNVELSQYAHIEMGQSPDSNYVSDNLDVGMPFLQGNAEFSAVYPVPKYSCTQPVKVCKKGDLLISVRAPVGEINIADQDYCIGRGLAAIRFQDVPPIVSKSLLEHAKSQLRKVAQGSTFEAINKNNLAELKIVKIPEEELSALESIARNLETQIRETEAIIAKLQQVKQGLLHDLLTRGVDENGELRPSYEDAPELYKSSELGWIPKDWEVGVLGDSLSHIDAGKSPSCPNEPASSGCWGVLKVSAVHPDGFKEHENKVVEAKYLQNPAYEVKSGDLLITRANTPELVGLPCLVETSRTKLMLSDKTLRLNIKKNSNKAFIFFTLYQPWVRKQIEILATGTSMSMKNISQSSLQSLLIKRPIKSEQDEIHLRVKQISDSIDFERRQLNKLKLKKSGLMDDLLTGKKRVTDLLKQQAN